TMLIACATITTPANAENFSWMDNWTTQVNFTFVRLKENANALQTGDKVNKLMHNYRKDDEFQYRAFLQPLDNIYLDSEDIAFAGYFRTNSKNIVITLLVIAAFILFIACFNFINLSTAGAISRAKETGVQKVLGAREFQLIVKFFSESFLLCSIALGIALLLVIIFLPLFNKVANTNLDTGFLQQSRSFGILFVLLLVISIVAGLYPAIFLSRFRSTDVFRNVIKASKSTWLRKSMVT